MITRPLGKADYDHIVQVIDRWWGGPTSALAHPLFFYELGSLARVVESDGVLVGFLFGFVAEASPRTGYVHLVGIHPDFRRRGVGKVLYQAFEEDCRNLSCTRLKAVTTSGNEGSIAGVIRSGVFGQMPPFPQLSDQEVRELAKYVLTLHRETTSP